VIERRSDGTGVPWWLERPGDPSTAADDGSSVADAVPSSDDARGAAPAEPAAAAADTARHEAPDEVEATTIVLEEASTTLPIQTQRIQTERIETERIETERIETERIEAEKVGIEKISTEKIEREKIGTAPLGAATPDPATSDPAATGTGASLSEPADAPPRRRRRRGVLALVIVLAVLVVLTVGYFVTDAVVRQSAQNQVRETIQQQLPPDVTAKDLTVDIKGFSVIGQYLGGRFDEVAISSSDLTVQGAVMSAHLEAYGVPTDFRKPVGRIDGTLSVDQDAVNKLVPLPQGTKVTLRHDAVGLTGTQSLLGIPLTYTASVTPTLQNGDTVVLTPHTVTIGAFDGSFDVTRFAKDLLPATIPVCVAQYLPAGVSVSSLTIADRSAVVAVQTTNMVVSESTMNRHGSCG
jgi:hypothetical protein